MLNLYLKFISFIPYQLYVSTVVSMKKSVKYHILGTLSALVAFVIVLVWAIMDKSQLVYEDGVYVMVHPFLTQSLPFIAMFAFMLGCTCFVLSRIEKLLEHS